LCELLPRADAEKIMGKALVERRNDDWVCQPVGLYTTVVFKGGGRTFVVTAPGRDKASELATPVARAVLSKLGA
jgi:hypothetical protein